MSDDNKLDEISKKLSLLVAISLRKETEKYNLGESVKFLSDFGITNQEIADILGTTKGTVEVLKSKNKKKSKK